MTRGHCRGLCVGVRGRLAQQRRMVTLSVVRMPIA